MPRKTVAEEIARLTAPQPLKALEVEVLRALPADMPAPLISNLRQPPRPADPDGWLSWGAPPYDPDKTYDPLAILRALEGAGWRLLPACFAKYGSWRGSVYPGLVEDLPEERRCGMGAADPLKSCAPIAPVWVRPEQHTASDAVMFFECPRPTAPPWRFRVSVDLPAGVVCVGARRREFRGGWKYEPGSAGLRFPASWHAVEIDGRGVVAGLASSSRAYRDTEQGLSAAIHFDLFAHDPQDWPLPASEFLAALLRPCPDTGTRPASWSPA